MEKVFKKDLEKKIIASNKKFFEKENIASYYFVIGAGIGVFAGMITGYLLGNVAPISDIQNKTQNKIVIDKPKADTTNYQTSFNYFDYNKK